jgi:hypothetical protein
VKILLGEFNATLGRENILKPTPRNESLHQYSNDSGASIVNFTTSKKKSRFLEHDASTPKH